MTGSNGRMATAGRSPAVAFAALLLLAVGPSTPRVLAQGLPDLTVDTFRLAQSIQFTRRVFPCGSGPPLAVPSGISRAKATRAFTWTVPGFASASSSPGCRSPTVNSRAWA